MSLMTMRLPPLIPQLQPPDPPQQQQQVASPPVAYSNNSSATHHRGLPHHPDPRASSAPQTQQQPAQWQLSRRCVPHPPIQQHLASGREHHPHYEAVPRNLNNVVTAQHSCAPAAVVSPRHAASPRAAYSTQKRASMEPGLKKEKEKFLIFIRVLIKYLEQNDPLLHLEVKAIVKECTQRSRNREPGYESVTGKYRLCMLCSFLLECVLTYRIRRVFCFQRLCACG
jgi:hypothetical protein